MTVRIVEDEIGRRFESLVSNPSRIAVLYPGDSVSPNPIYSGRYANCNGVALLAEGVAGLTHYGLTDRKPEDYLNGIINRMERIGQFPTGAVVVGGDERHFKRNKRILKERGIPVIGEYLDCWSDGEEFLFEGLRRKIDKGDKEVLVIPEDREVLMYSEAGGKYIRLTPN